MHDTDDSGTQGVILFGHGSRDPAWAAPLLRVQAALREEAPDVRVEVAFLEFLSPSLPEAVERLAAQCARVRIVPFFMSQSGHVQRDVPPMLEAARARHPGLQLVLADPIGESPAVIAAIAGYALAER